MEAQTKRIQIFRKQFRPLSCFFVALAFVTVVGCAPESGKRVGPRLLKDELNTEAARSFDPSRVNSVLVFGVRRGDALSGDAASADLSSLKSQLVSAFEVGTSMEVSAVKDEALSDLSAESALSLKKKACEAAGKAGVQSALYGLIDRYRESNGSAFGATEPAEVGFQLFLVEPKTCQTLWTASFDKAEHPISENILELPNAVRGGVGYKGSARIAQDGFQRAAKELERMRQVAPTHG